MNTGHAVFSSWPAASADEQSATTPHLRLVIRLLSDGPGTRGVEVDWHPTLSGKSQSELAATPMFAEDAARRRSGRAESTAIWAPPESTYRTHGLKLLSWNACNVVVQSTGPRPNPNLISPREYVIPLGQVAVIH